MTCEFLPNYLYRLSIVSSNLFIDINIKYSVSILRVLFNLKC